MSEKERQTATEAIEWEALRCKSLEPGGFKEERMKLWPALLNVSSAVQESRSHISLTSTFIEKENSGGDDEEVQEHRDERQIGLDTDRSFVLYPELQTSCAEKISLHRVRDSMGLSLEPVVGLLRVLKRLLHEVDSEFASILERTAPLPYFALSNILTLFSHDVPTLPLIQHIFDYLLCRHPIAIVYLVAAVTLSRRDEVCQMEKEGEDGSIHSILSSLPELYEEEENIFSGDLKLDEQSRQDTVTAEVQLDAADKTSMAVLRDAKEDPPSVNEADHLLDDTSESPPDPSFGIAEQSIDKFTSEAGLSHITESTNISTVCSETSVPPSSTQSELPNGDSFDGSDANEELSAQSHSRPPSPSPSPSVASSDTAPARSRVSLTSLLMNADRLFAQYPPSHPSISLSSIMGPQSVMLTWSEDSGALPDDDEAELMVTKPELIVLPHIEPEDEIASDDESFASVSASKNKKRKEKAERARRKLRKPRHLVLQRKTVVAGAVLVLGVTVAAVYGMQSGGPAGIFRGDAHHQRNSLGRDWKRMSQFMGGMVIGVGERMLDGLWH
ncbi:uncharacterized protein FIBRA_08255 [Fibroporia radiculosa]|uniref:Rab-GAP TBC domain-containing protein n=1 Tax=Fibroporia radiculosa TaxID=599839 RepID=J4I2F6_9APHY|nr:uncharacterized protein FIBRA_08255 [Fibroporia radiculosa]CCM06012.1 predicted protein [Fibroporia radiculosa]